MEGVRIVLLDIEGTVCPISFVKETLFPYAIKALLDVLSAKWDEPDFQPYRDAFPEEYRKDPKTLQAHVEDLTKRDVKIAYLKNLQGYLWEEGYKTGAYSTPLFADVVPALRRWSDDDYSLAIYSSGSVFAQKLLFGHVGQATDDTPAPSKKRGRPTAGAEDQAEAGAPPPAKKLATGGGEAADSVPARDNESKVEATGDDATEEATDPTATGDAGEKHEQAGEVEDLTDWFAGWFDTTNAGLKTNASSYEKIAQELKCQPEEILFLSDNVKEVDAAIEAKMKSIVVDRPGNAPLSDEDKERLQVVESLADIELPRSSPEGK